MKKLLLIFAMAIFACNAGFAQTAHDLYADSERVITDIVNQLVIAYICVFVEYL